MKKRASHLTAALMALAPMVCALSAAQAQTVAKNCRPPPTGVVFKAAQGNVMTLSTTFVTVPGTAINFRQGGSKPGCVIVFFSALGGIANTGALFHVRATINGVAGFPQDIRWSGDDDENSNVAFLRSRGVSFAFPSIAPGAHTLRIQYRTPSGGIGQFRERNTIVYYVR